MRSHVGADQSGKKWNIPARSALPLIFEREGGRTMKRYLFVAAVVSAIAAPAIADDVGVRVGPVGAGVSVGETHDRDRDRDRTTVVKEHEPESKTVIKKEDDLGNRE